MFHAFDNFLLIFQNRSQRTYVVLDKFYYRFYQVLPVSALNLFHDNFIFGNFWVSYGDCILIIV